MSSKATKATLSKGRSGWCVIYRHPVVRTQNGDGKLRIRRGLGTRDDAEAQALVAELNEILSDPQMWTIGARERAATKYRPQVVSAFYEYLTPESSDAWALRDRIIPLPGAADGYARVLMIGTTGAGKTTIVRQLLGTDPERERFPSTSAAKTTICDIEVVCRDGEFTSVVAFMPKERARQYIADCISAAVSRRIQGADRSEVARRFLEHTDQQFRLSYVLGTLGVAANAQEELTDDSEVDAPSADEGALVNDVERAQISARVSEFVGAIESLSDSLSGEVETALGTKISELPAKDVDAFEELVEEKLAEHEEFHLLVDQVLEEVEERFDFLDPNALERGRDGWPRLWTWGTSDRDAFIREVNRFSSNFAPSFGRLLTPLVEGIRVAGPFGPTWSSRRRPKIVLFDGRGIGHTADSASSVSTSITRRYELADAILLVDNAAQPMQAAPCAVLRSLAASGYESKLILCFTHFDEVTGDNLPTQAAKKGHVLSSVDNAISAIGKALGRDAQHAIQRLLPDRAVFFASIQRRLSSGARFTLGEFDRLISLITASIVEPGPVTYRPIYDLGNLALSVQSATQEFHDAWRGRLGMGGRGSTPREHWTRVKALTKRVGVLNEEEYDTLMPVADMIRVLQDSISRYLSEPVEWLPTPPPENAADARVLALAGIKTRVNKRLHDLAKQRLLEERGSGWLEAYQHRGTGSTRDRARDLTTLYESAAPIPNEMPSRDVNEFLQEVRDIVAHSIVEGGGEVPGWKPPELEILPDPKGDSE